ncbi:PepSY domain-containing protein [Paracoccus jeotgali]|uniref:PepSY domain-containing protein n=1 Tax=Paracoccus jeotgali TaxID=2065379 RepID=A0A2K9MHN0_9RHOB|nr:PepSY domain-containing protein [Paracoccus jeotgali]
MKKTLTILGFLAVFPAGVALADDDCAVPMADWQPRAAVAALAEGKGWTVRRLKIDDGCYEIKGSDAEGRRFKVKLDPASLEIVKWKSEDDDDDDDDDREDKKRRHDTRRQPARTMTAPVVLPPPNGLLGNGAPPAAVVR